MVSSSLALALALGVVTAEFDFDVDVVDFVVEASVGASGRGVVFGVIVRGRGGNRLAR